MEKLTAIVGGIAILAIGVLIFLGVHTTTINGQIIQKNWSRTIVIDKYDWVHHKHTGSTCPEGAINFRTWSETTSSVSIDPDGGVSLDVDTEDYVEYDIMEWTYSRQVSSSGYFPVVPKWPEYTLGSKPREREAERDGTYTIVVKRQDQRIQNIRSRILEDL